MSARKLREHTSSPIQFLKRSRLIWTRRCARKISDWARYDAALNFLISAWKREAKPSEAEAKPTYASSYKLRSRCEKCELIDRMARIQNPDCLDVVCPKIEEAGDEKLGRIQVFRK
jgi:hypothetical protein